MEFTSFTNILREEMEKKVGEHARVKLQEVMKNNGVKLCGMTVMRQDSNISPTIYLNNYYQAYERDEITLHEAVEDIWYHYRKNQSDKSVDICFFMNYEMVKKRIVYKLVNTERNRELLQDVPHISFHDLSIVFQCLVSEEMFGNATILIHNAHLKLWGVDVQELYRQASLNTPRLYPYDIKNMKEVILEMIRLEEGEEAVVKQREELKQNVPMYVLSNRMKIQGAACLLYEDILKDFAMVIQEDIYILPSSIHEVILLPRTEADNPLLLKEMVKEINETQVEVEEVLSNSVYLYERKTGKIHVY